MLVYAGIDEAGYGPMLGPLCVATSVFVLPGDDPAAGAPNLWSRLSGSICRSRKDRRKRVAVDDSKKLKGANSSATTHPLLHLERGVLAFAGAAGELPEDDETLFAALGIAVPGRPWYVDAAALPTAQTVDEVRILASRVRRTLERAGVHLHGLGARAVDADDFNAQVDAMGTKAAVNFRAVIQHMDAVWRAYPDAHPRVIVDRQGGRAHYREELQRGFPESHITIIAETDTVSRYRMEDGDRALTVSFETGGEDRHLPVALASMVAKYARELLMARLNRFFQGHLPELKPTAGYVQDARRYLADIEPVIRDLGIARDALVRRV
ncbi:MAG: hypothetical protein KDA25_09140 [Phycisphaerales bacterium]|nr:hypothetical protein [Phycisphaerales bacterium]